MKPLYILDRYDGSVRRERATITEVRDVIAGRRTERLARVEIGEDGDLVTHELTAAELQAIAADFEADLARRVHAALDSTLALAKQISGFDGLNLGNNGVLTVWNWRHHDNESVARSALAWAELRGYEIQRNSPPATGKSYYPDATIIADGIDVCRIVWDSVECNTDATTEKEIADVQADRVVADRELDAIAESF